MGPFEGLSYSQLLAARARMGVPQRYDATQVWGSGAEGVETDRQVVDRCKKFLSWAEERVAAGEDVIAVTHAGVVKSIVHRLLGVSSDRPYAFEFSLGSATALVRVSDYWCLREFRPNGVDAPRRFMEV